MRTSSRAQGLPRGRAGIVILGLLCAVATPAYAQISPDSAAILLNRDTIPTLTISPRGAMIRSFIMPGWGQAAVGSYFRGGVWFTTEAASVYMLFRTIGRLRDAQHAKPRVIQAILDSLQSVVAQESQLRRRVIPDANPASVLLEDTTELQSFIDSHPMVLRVRNLTDSRRQQRQDWITYTLFFTLLSGVDAYVNAHLKDFPASIASEIRRDGTLGVSVRMPLPGWAGGGSPPSGGARAGRPRW